ncbi:hypothetical protein GCWU000324_02007 [Kingella oralis ATCC 51147]|uniref:Uncharacterized protein n=1 Tax=Kingella oralis ATCC 51147 TaxID=629741 RepID=C4GIY5_9NEIS|nr:hypothetical protein GCWU000324_02007 [Kingella oralis ATCC 51147]
MRWLRVAKRNWANHNIKRCGSLKTGGLLFMAAGGTCPIALGATMLKSPATYIRTAPCLRRACAWCWNFC